MDTQHVLTTCADFGRLVRLLPDCLMVVTPSGEVLYANLEASQLLTRLTTHTKQLPKALTIGEHNGNITILDLHYSEVVLHIQTRRIVWQNHSAWLWQLRDVTAATRQQRTLEQLVYRDHLTGLYNRRGLEHAVTMLNHATRIFPYCMTMMYIDIDGLKQINDHYGHAEGDAIIRETADILTQTFHIADIKARIGGDEFVVIAKYQAHRTESDLMSQLLGEVRRRNSQRARPYDISLSIGSIKYVAREQISLTDILANADKAMYQRKVTQKPLTLTPRPHPLQRDHGKNEMLLAI